MENILSISGAPENRKQLQGAKVVQWDQNGLTVPASITATNNTFEVEPGLSLRVSHLKIFAGGSAKNILERSDQVDGDWDAGNFKDNEKLLSTDSQHAGDGPITIRFQASNGSPKAVKAVGAQIQSATLGEFTGVIRAVDSTGHIHEFKVLGDSTDKRNGKAIFLGVKSETGTPAIVRVDFLTTNIVAVGHGAFDPAGFAINQLSVVI